jgi:hypothetical protein
MPVLFNATVRFIDEEKSCLDQLNQVKDKLES